MNKYLLAFSLLLAGYSVEAALISRTYTYSDGNTLSANENNTNENTLYNEINGNLNNANILDGGLATADYADSSVTTAKIADANVTTAKLSATLQSTFTYVNTFGNYRRPVLKWIDNKTVDVENNTGTSNQTCIQFPDERRCVTEDTTSTSVNRRLIVSETASYTGTKNSGVATGQVLTNGQWYATYAVKVQDNSTDFVLAISTYHPTQANYSTLNTLFNTNGWVYLGMIVYQDSTGSTNHVAKFTQAGNYTMIRSSATTSTIEGRGIRLANTASASTLTWSYSAGFTTLQVPSHILIGQISCIMGTSTIIDIDNSSGNSRIFRTQSPSSSISAAATFVSLEDGIRCTANGATTQSIMLSGWIDGVLGVGYNPAL